LEIYVKGRGVKKVYLVQPETPADNRKLQLMNRQEVTAYVSLFKLSGGKPKRVREWPHGVIIKPHKEEEEKCPEK
jgi:hypothetical protein